MLIEKQTQLAGLLAQIDLRERLAKGYQAKLDALPKTRAERRERHATRLEDEREREKLEHSLFQLENGANWNAGICHPELELLAGKPGLRQLRVQAGRLEREIKELKTVEAQWAKGTRKFRYTGKPDKYRHDDGRYLEPGDEVELTKAGAMALRDMFEAVDETATVG